MKLQVTPSTKQDKVKKQSFLHDDTGRTLEVIILTAIPVLIGVGVGVLIYNAVSAGTQNIQEVSSIVDAVVEDTEVEADQTTSSTTAEATTTTEALEATTTTTEVTETTTTTQAPPPSRPSIPPLPSIPTTTPTTTPSTPPSTPPPPSIRQSSPLSTGRNHACTVLANGNVACWGANRFGQLDTSAASAQIDTPSIVNGITATQVATGRAHTCALLEDKTVQCWGNNDFGQLGSDSSSAFRASAILSPSTLPSSVPIINVERISAGGSHTCALLEDRTVVCWGLNNFGQLGDGTTTNSTIPVTAGISNATQVSAGFDYSCAVLADGTVQCWGNNEAGQLGDGTTTNRLTPVTTGISESTGINSAVQISAGFDYSCAVLADGTVRCWGNNQAGQLGDGTTTNSSIPVTTEMSESNATQVSAGYFHTCAVLIDETVQCWGNNEVGQLGDGTTTNRLTPVTAGINNASRVSTGERNTCAVLTDGDIQCWGNDEAGQLGRASQPMPIALISDPGTAIQVTTGSEHTCAIFTGGAVRCWGSTAFGLLGNGNIRGLSSTPVAVVGIDGSTDEKSATQISAGGSFSSGHTCALLEDKTLQCWGGNFSGQLGDGTTTNRLTPVVAGISGSNAAQVSAGGFHTCALLEDKTIQCWGSNDFGQLGDGAFTQRPSPFTVSGIDGSTPEQSATQVSAGSSHTCALLDDKTVQCWGSNSNGQLGDGTTTDSNTPVTVAGIGELNGATQISAGERHTCAILEDKTAQCWGDNGQGQLGSGFSADSNIPISVALLDGTSPDKSATQISAGGSFSSAHTCALLEDTTLKCWGDNTFGQLGDGTQTDSFTPITVSVISTATQISASKYGHTCAILTTGSVSCWGNNWYSQMGTSPSDSYSASPAPALSPTSNIPIQISTGEDNSCTVLANGSIACWGFDDFTETIKEPFIFAGITTATQVSVGGSRESDHACALLENKAILCWGNNGDGQLGDGTFTQRLTPIIVSGIDGSTPEQSATQVSAGGAYTCAVLEDKTIQCWGINTNGQLGDGTTMFSRTPVTVSGISELNGATQVSAGGGHTCALLEDKTIQCWGGNFRGALGDGTTTSRRTPVTVTGITTATQVSNGGGHTCAVLKDKTVQCWGRNSNGQLGDPTESTERNAFSSTPVSVSGISTATQVSTGVGHTCALLEDKTIQCWGLNGQGQLGDGTTTDRLTPVLVSEINSVIQVSVGDRHTCALLISGNTQCWGANEAGQLGQRRQSIPLASTLGLAIQVSTGAGHTCSILEDKTIQCWGNNGEGQLGDGTTTDSYTPVLVSGINTATQVSVVSHHTCALLEDKTIQCWGNNSSGQLGDGTTLDRHTPVTVVRITTATQISAGGASSTGHTCAVLEDKSIQCWGDNAQGQLGAGITTDSKSPAIVSGIGGSNGATQISAGGTHTCALLEDKTIQCWGNNSSGQLGDGMTLDRNTPVAVAGIATATQISAGSFHTCALLEDKTIQCWGNNAEGQLGDGTTTRRLTPVVTARITTATQVLTGSPFDSAHTCALLEDKTIQCWGANEAGQLGDGTTTDRLTPVLVSGINTVTQVSIGEKHTCAISATDKTVKCWGDNGAGQLGDEPDSYSIRPVRVFFPA